MPRSARKMSDSCIYHVMLRGINRQDIFEDEEDFLRFLAVLKECKEISGYELYAYCLMANHIHLLIRTGKEPLDLIFKRLGSRFVYWYNLKYRRTGHLFQDRYRSEPVEDDSYFLTVLRYILQNPMKAGLEKTPGLYPWSSYNCYTGKPDQLTDTEFAVQMFRCREELVDFLNRQNEDTALDMPAAREGVTDDQAREIMMAITGCGTVSEFQALGNTVRKEYVSKLREKNLSLGQIVRMTGMSKATVYRATL